MNTTAIRITSATPPKTRAASSTRRFPLAAEFQHGVSVCRPARTRLIGFCVWLKDAKGGVAAVFVDTEFDVRFLPIAAPDKTEQRQQQMTLTALPKLSEGLLRTQSARPFIASGDYDVYISVGTGAGKPTIELPLENDDGRRRYRIGKVTIKVMGP